MPNPSMRSPRAILIEMAGTSPRLSGSAEQVEVHWWDSNQGRHSGARSSREPGIQDHERELCGENRGYGFRARASKSAPRNDAFGLNVANELRLPPALLRR